MLKGAGQLPGGTITCPVHRWAYDSEGRHIGAPHFPDHPCLDLPRQDLQQWHGMLFNGPRDIAKDLAGMGAAKDLDFEGYVLDRVDVVDYDFNWKTFIEVYLEDYHVAPFHPGLGHFVTCDDLKWEYGDWYSVQTVGVNNALAPPGQRRVREVARAGAEVPPRRAAAARRDLAHLLPEHHGRVVPARAGDLHALARAGPEKCATWSSSTTPRRSPSSSASSWRPSRRPTTRPRSRTRTSATA